MAYEGPEPPAKGAYNLSPFCFIAQKCAFWEGIGRLRAALDPLLDLARLRRTHVGRLSSGTGDSSSSQDFAEAWRAWDAAILAVEEALAPQARTDAAGAAQDASQGKPSERLPAAHIQPRTGKTCNYSAIDFCNKCGWTAGTDGAGRDAVQSLTKPPTPSMFTGPGGA